jgi:hypothetical protein
MARSPASLPHRKSSRSSPFCRLRRVRSGSFYAHLPPFRERRRALLRSIGAYLVAAVLLLHSSSAFRQALNEFRDTEPGSQLFGILQVVIGTSAVVSAFGLIKRARWAAWSVVLCGIATAALIAVQPLYEPMESDVQQSLWLGAAAIGVAAAGVSWFARRLARRSAASSGVADKVPGGPPSAAEILDVNVPAEPTVMRTRDAHASRVARPRRDDDSSKQ